METDPDGEWKTPRQRLWSVGKETVAYTVSQDSDTQTIQDMV